MALFPLRGFVDLWLCRFAVGGVCKSSVKTRDSLIAERLDTVTICSHKSSVHMSSILEEQIRLLPSVPSVEDNRGPRLDLNSPANLDRFPAQPCTRRRHNGLCLPIGHLSSRTGCSSCCRFYCIETRHWADTATRLAARPRAWQRLTPPMSSPILSLLPRRRR
jgi:hypothetical protein